MQNNEAKVNHAILLTKIMMQKKIPLYNFNYLI